MRALLAMCFVVVVNCGTTPTSAPESGSKGMPPHRQQHVAPEVDAAAVDFSGTCEWARSPGELSAYRVRVRTLVEAVVRSDARFDGADDDNVLGRLDSGEALVASGPVTHPRYDYGEGYAVLIRGHAGRICRGYVRASTVAPM